MQKRSMLRKAVLVVALSLTVASPALADTFVNGYLRRDGTYVQPHYRSDPDGNFYNNWGTYGNVNPYTGQWGMRQYPNYSFPSYRSYSFPTYPSWSSRSHRWNW